MKKISRILLLIILFSCGIPSYEYIEEPTVGYTSDSSFTFNVELDDDGYINGFKLYARYFKSQSDDTSFSDIEISDTNNDTEDYLEDLGYTLVSFVNTSFYSTNGVVDYDYLEDNGLIIDLFSVTSDISFTVSYNSNYSIPVVMTSDYDSNTYTLISNYSSLIHTIGIYDDDNGEYFLDSFSDETNIYIEFAVFNTGLSSSLESLESLPVYTTAIQLQTN